ncbi:unnamed protein product [Lactuca saligna]|uniref:Gamma-tubulin complex component n=1 Tax=Lactuca saligna TaxID=75948 RepID=A0AA35VLD1_LACSI|nr:unnamed protein product [Lactuca saligna]
MMKGGGWAGYKGMGMSLLDLALRSTATVADPLHEDVTCSVDVGSLFKRLSILKDLQTGDGGETVSEADVVEEPLITGMETFSVNYKVLELNWHVMHNKLENAKSINEVIQYHDFFMEKCLKECSLLSPILLKKFEKLKLVCLQYAAATQWLMSSIEAPDSNSSIDDLHSSSLENLKVLKLRKSSKKPNSPTDESTVIECVLKFEREFSSELESLRPILSSRAQAEPYLTHLAQLILGVGMDHHI